MDVALVGTDDGFAPIGTDMPRMPAGHVMQALASGPGGIWAVSDRSRLWRHRQGSEFGEVVAEVVSGDIHCVLPTNGSVLVGGASARLYELIGSDLIPVAGFDDAPGRDTWHTPWGGPPDVRSMALDVDGTIYLNVHVGGVLRSTDGGRSWEATMDISADVHEVVAHHSLPGTAYAASAIGLGTTSDGAASWTFETSGLHGVYCRAVAVGDDYLLVSASLGAGGRQAAVYRRPLDGAKPFRRCTEGLPEWFEDNVNTFCLAVRGPAALIGAADGTVYRSDDRGESWTIVAAGLPGLHCLEFVDLG